MNQEVTLQTLRELCVFDTDAGGGVRALYERSLATMALSAADYLCIRDLLALSGLSARGELHALLLVMFDAVSAGSLCVNAESEPLSARLARVVPSDEDAAALSARIRQGLETGAYDALIAGDAAAYMPLLWTGKHIYFQKYYRHADRLRASLRARLALSPFAMPGDAQEIFDDVLREHPVQFGGRPIELNPGQKLALMLGLQQRLLVVSGGPGTGKTSIVIALLRCLVRRGGAAERMRLVAPTGRAARRMADTVRSALASIGELDAADASLGGVASSTIHRLLRYDPSRNTFVHHANNRLQLDVLVVDEVSMVDVVLMASLLEAVPDDATVILLGDKDQLPSVDAGCVLADLMPRAGQSVVSARTREQAGLLLGVPADDLPAAADTGDPMSDHVVVLAESYRSEQSILEVAGVVNDPELGTVPDAHVPPLVLSRPQGNEGRPSVEWPVPEYAGGVARCAGGGCRALWDEAHSAADHKAVLSSWAAHHYVSAGRRFPEREGRETYCETLRALQECDLNEPNSTEPRELLENAFSYLDQARILTLVRRGLRGCEGINRHLCAELREVLDPAGEGGVFAGAPVLVTRNDPMLELFNGDVGLFVKGRDHMYRALFRCREGFAAFPASALPPHEPAFAITIHKSQGSEYDQVLLVLPADAGSRLLTREILYTGLTRARYLAVICGTREVLDAASSRGVDRESGLDLWG